MQDQRTQATHTFLGSPFSTFCCIVSKSQSKNIQTIIIPTTEIAILITKFPTIKSTKPLNTGIKYAIPNTMLVITKVANSVVTTVMNFLLDFTVPVV